MTTIALIALGGALGALARYGVNLGAIFLVGADFPWGTLAVNVLGSFLMGLIVVKFVMPVAVSESVRVFLMVGFLGAFTTFSTYSLDVINLWQRGEALSAISYMMGSVIFSVGALALAFWIFKGEIS